MTSGVLYRAAPVDARRGALVLLPGLDGLTEGLRATADEFADSGYEVVVPSLLEPLQHRGGLSNGDPVVQDDIARTHFGLDCAPAIQAAIDALAPPVFALGFAFGGTLAWVAAARCSGLTAAASFYGGHIIRHIDEGLRCPIVLHFGKHDPLIPPTDVERIVEARPDLPVWIYDAGHGFAVPGQDYAEDAAHLALLRTRQLFHRSGGARGEMGG